MVVRGEQKKDLVYKMTPKAAEIYKRIYDGRENPWFGKIDTTNVQDALPFALPPSYVMKIQAQTFDRSSYRCD